MTLVAPGEVLVLLFQVLLVSMMRVAWACDIDLSCPSE